MVHAVLFTDSYGSMRNGVAVAVQLLREYLVASGQQVTVVAPAEGLTTVRTEVTGGAEVRLSSFRLPGIHPRMAAGPGFRVCLRSLQKANPDVVHVHGFGPVSLLGIYFARLTNTPLLLTWHTDIGAYVRHYRYLKPFLFLWAALAAVVCGKRKPLAFFTERHIVDRFAATLTATADLVLAPSEKIAKKLRELPVDTPVITIPVGVDPIPPSTTVPQSLSTLAGPVLLYVGRIAPEKGIDLLLDAFEILGRQRPDATLILAGDHRCARGLKNRLRAARRSNVVLTGELERGALAGLYARADLFVFPSLTDTQGLVLQEAAHAGLPLVVVDGELLNPVVKDSTTTRCEPDPHALAAAMTHILELRRDEGWSSTVGKAARALAGRHSSERHCRKVVALYLRCTGRRT